VRKPPVAAADARSVRQTREHLRTSWLLVQTSDRQGYRSSPKVISRASASWPLRPCSWFALVLPSPPIEAKAAIPAFCAAVAAGGSVGARSRLDPPTGMVEDRHLPVWSRALLDSIGWFARTSYSGSLQQPRRPADQPPGVLLHRCALRPAAQRRLASRSPRCRRLGAFISTQAPSDGGRADLSRGFRRVAWRPQAKWLLDTGTRGFRRERCLTSACSWPALQL
jgi:hypothetical protein